MIKRKFSFRMRESLMKRGSLFPPFLPPRNFVEETSFVQKGLTKRLRLRITIEERLFHRGHFKSRASFAVGARIRHRLQESQ